MQIVTIITQSQYESIVGKQFSKDCSFSPIKDFYDNWVVTMEELLAIENEEFSWLWDLPQSIYVPKFENNINQ